MLNLLIIEGSGLTREPLLTRTGLSPGRVDGAGVTQPPMVIVVIIQIKLRNDIKSY